MSNLLQFVANYDDLSTDKGYQFKFHCDKCHNGYMSRYQTSTIGMAGSLLNAAGSIFGGFFNEAGNAAYQMQRAVGGKAHDEALTVAVQEGKQHFKQCTRCGHWVCPEVCWNHQAGLCETCAPDEQEELSAQQAHATSEQIYTKTRQQDYTKNIDFLNRGGISQCSNCHSKLSPGQKFCSACGNAVAAASAQGKFCAGCGTSLQADQRFCNECGQQQ
jgi:uncharacterized OB-fold protein